ncbi:MAG TPA: DNA alkylation repair protein [bacterium]|nr:DNA alkylation repair protein [bacterium]
MRRDRRSPARTPEPLNPRTPEPPELVAAIRRQFEVSADPRYRESIQRFFKEKIDVYGVKTPDARRIYKEYFKKVKHLPKDEILEICELLHHGTKYEEHGIAFSWAGKLSKRLEASDFSVLEGWLQKYVNNWASCDTFCGGAVGDFLLRFPEFLPRLRGWAKSKNRWLRRASAVALIQALKAAPGEGRSEKLEARTQNPFVSQAYETADVMLLDKDDMVQKGYGWMLKELAESRPREVFEFVMACKDRMPRTALRYAIEKMPAAWKKQAMAK